jgi:serine phosphatase RsbU (regulator of sigma subunit)
MHKSINTVDQSKLARTLNKSFDQISSGSKFATALLMTYYAPSGHLILVNAGHPPPLIRRAGTDQWIPLDQQTPGVLRETTSEVKVGIKNLPLGVIGSTQYEQIAIKINEGDRICAYTDAFTEAQHTNGSLLGTNGLAETLNRTQIGKASENASSILTDIQSRGFNAADDDHTMLMLHNNGQASSSIKIETVSNYIKNSFGLGHRDTVLT